MKETILTVIGVSVANIEHFVKLVDSTTVLCCHIGGLVVVAIQVVRLINKK